MTSELSLLAKATLVLAFGLLGARLARGSRASVRHLILASAFGALLLLPMGVAIAPPMVVEVPVSARVAAAAATGAPSSARGGDKTTVVRESAAPTEAARMADIRASLGRLLSSPLLPRGIWSIGFLLLMVVLTRSLWKLRSIARQGIPWLDGEALANRMVRETGGSRDVTVLLHEQIAAPITCGFARSLIVMPKDAPSWDEADVHRAFIHELEHVRRGDWVVQLMARTVCALYWFHPLAWVAWRQLCLEGERACDDAVLGRSEHTDYAHQLVSLAERLSHSHSRPALSMANRSDLAVRVKAVLDGKQNRGRAGRALVLASVAVAGLGVALLAPVSVVAVAPRDGAASEEGEQRRNRTSRALGRALLEAADEGDAEAVSDLLNNGADANVVIDGDGSPLIAAARGGHRDVVQLLLDRGADPNLAVSGDGSPLISAARLGSLSIVNLLLDRGADINLGIPGDGNPLIMAAGDGRAHIVRLLLDRGANIEEVVAGDENPLIHACEGGQLEVVKLLVSRGANLNARVWADGGGKNGEWRTPMSMARRGGHGDLVDYLLAAGAPDAGR